MYLKTMRDYLEGQASLADLDCAVSADVHPEKARAKAESELALDWDMKSIFANIPPPPVGLSAVKKALKSIPHPPQDSETHEFIQEIAALSRASYSEMPEPSGGFAQAQQRIKDKLAAAPTPVFDEQETTEFDINPNFDQQPFERRLVLVESKRRRGVTKKIIGLPRHTTGGRDVLAAGKDLPNE